MKKTLIIAISLFLSFKISAQEKIEREKRVRRNEVPESAIKFMDDAFEGLKRIKWYHEITSGKESYEAKLKWDGKIYSVEFNDNGVIEDIERQLDFNELPDEVKGNLNDWFQCNYTRFKIRKLQEQWTGSPDDLEDAIDEQEIEEVEIRYEIEYYGKNEEQDNLWEGLFDDEGKFIQKRKMIIRPTDNLNF
jgi:hypothetical protein